MGAEIAKKMPAKTNLMVGRTEIPKWIGQEFEVWRKEIEKWIENDKSSEETKYCNVMESLKKNDRIKEYVVRTLAEKTENDRKLGAILDVMAEKYERTESERCLGLMKEIVNFKVEGEIESITDRFERMMTETKKVDLAAKLDFALTLQFIDRLEKEGKISSVERMRLLDEIETKEGKSKVRNSAEIVQKEVRRMKVINNREKVFDKTIDTHYVRDNSRYGKWNSQMERNGYRRSDSRKGFWRNGAAASGQRYLKDRNGSRFRSQSGGRGFSGNFRSKSQGNGDRSGSKPPYKSELAKDVESNKKDLQAVKLQLKEILDKVKESHFVEEEYIMNVRYVNETKGIQMIVDSGAPVSIATSKWMEKYLNEMEVDRNEITERECNRKFKMGESVYKSTKELTLPVRMRTDDDSFVKKMITISVVNRDDDSFLCGLKTLMEWKAAVFYEKCELRFDDSQKKVKIQISGGGHQLVKLETLGEVSNEEAVFYIEKKKVGANKKDIEKMHRVLNHKGVRNMEFAFRNAGRMDTQVGKMIKEVVENCSVCQKSGRSRSKPSVAIPRATDFNSIVTLDLKEMGKKYILWMVDAFSRTLAGAIIKDKKAETILEQLEMEWCNK